MSGYQVHASRSPSSRTSSPLSGYLAQQPQRVSQIGDKLSDFEIIKELGRGAFGVVFLVRSHLDNQLYVLKKLKHGRRHKEALREARLLRNIKHPHIITYHHCFVEADCLYLVMEYAEGGDLHRVSISLTQHLKRQKAGNKYIEELQIWHYAYQLLLGLQYLHTQHILHRDIKCMNLLLDRHNRLKIGDLGVSKLLTGVGSLTPKPGQRVGTPLYLAPEIIKHQSYEYKADTWAAGCVLYQLAALHPPFRGDNMLSLNNAIVHKELPPLPKQYSVQLQDLINSLLEKKQEKRLDVEEALKKIPACVRVQYDFKELELEPQPTEKPRQKEKKIMERKLSIRPAVVSVAEQRELLLQGSRNKTPQREVSSRLSGFSRLSSMSGKEKRARMSNMRGAAAVSLTRPTTSGEGVFKLGSMPGGSRNGFATFYKGSRQLKPTPLRPRTSFKSELPEQPIQQRIPERSKIRVSAEFPLERLDLSKKIQQRLVLCQGGSKINKRSHILPDVRRSAAVGQSGAGEVTRVSQQDRRPTTSLVRLTNSLFSSKRPSTSHLNVVAVSPRRALTPHLCEQQVEGVAEEKQKEAGVKKSEMGSKPPKPKPEIKEAINMLKTAMIWRGVKNLRVSTEMPQQNNSRGFNPHKYLSPQHYRREMMTESTAASKCEVRCSVSRKKEPKRFTVADLQ